MTPTLQRFTASAATDDIAAVHAAIDRDGGVIVEGLLSPDVIDRVNADMEDAVAAADPHAELFNPVLNAFHGPFTRQVSGIPGISPTFATDVM